jgi:hypothetical protein
MRNRRSLVGLLAFSVVLLVAAQAVFEGQQPSEAPAGFDGLTNGYLDRST